MIKVQNSVILIAKGQTETQVTHGVGGGVLLGFDWNYKNESTIMGIKKTFKNEAMINI